MALAEDGRALRLHGHHLHSGIFALEKLTHTGQGAAGAYAGYERIHLTVRIRPDLRAGGLKMGLGVGGIYELTGNKAVWDLPCQLIGLGNGALHALGAFGENQLRAVGFHDLTALHAHGFRHDDDDPVAPGGGYGGQTDTGVAAGGLNDDRTGLQKALGLSVIDHGLGNAVLHAAGGIEIFQLGHDSGLQTKFLFQMGQLQQGGMADQLIGGGIDTRHKMISFLCCRMIY